MQPSSSSLPQPGSAVRLAAPGKAQARIVHLDAPRARRMIRQEYGRRVEFAMLFKGFDYFVQSLIATLFMVVPVIVLAVPAYVALLIPALGMVIGRPPNAPPDATAVWSFVTAMALFYAFIF